jgi:hypothetical protein
LPTDGRGRGRQLQRADPGLNHAMLLSDSAAINLDVAAVL